MFNDDFDAVVSHLSHTLPQLKQTYLWAISSQIGGRERDNPPPLLTNHLSSIEGPTEQSHTMLESLRFPFTRTLEQEYHNHLRLLRRSTTPGVHFCHLQEVSRHLSLQLHHWQWIWVSSGSLLVHLDITRRIWFWYIWMNSPTGVAFLSVYLPQRANEHVLWLTVQTFAASTCTHSMCMKTARICVKAHIQDTDSISLNVLLITDDH